LAQAKVYVCPLYDIKRNGSSCENLFKDETYSVLIADHTTSVSTE
jgi:hypothetical protein